MTVDLNRQFLERVVVWPGSQSDPGWINLHCHLKNPDPTKNGGKPWVIGRPFKSIDNFISYAKWVDTTDSFFDVWYCTSLQSDATTNRNGKPKAVRLHRNAISLKAIWIDCDVKAGDPTKHYETMQAAWGAISAFRKKVGLPQPSALVNSGGGLHVYWISDIALSPQDWRTYSEGLKQLLLAEGVLCDTGLTTDDVRILRVPGTHNHKYDPPRPVHLLHLGKDYNFGTDLSFLKTVEKFVGTVADTTGSTSVDVVNIIDPSFGDATPAAAFAGLQGGGALQSGITPTGPSLVAPLPIFKGCKFLRDALDTGGANYDNPLWNLSVLCTAFMENGNVFAHEISKRHASYTPADTQALYDRKVADRHERGIGYPSCSAIAGSGCQSCATCPLLAKGKSPLNIRPAAPPAAVVTATVNKPAARQTAAAIALQLPDRYDVNSDGVICLIEDKVDRDGNVTELWLPLFLSRLMSPWVQKDPDIIHMQASYDKGNWIWTSIRHEDWCGQGFEKKLAAAKIKYVSANKAKLEAFFMDWLSKMHDAAVAQTAQAFGWYHEAGVLRGFAFGGFIHRDDGSSIQAGLTDRHTQKRFQPTGQMKPWYTAASYMMMQKRPELEVVIAASFAAPLMAMTGVTGAMLSAWGTSGVGKTYALEVGAAVWGHPKESKEVTSTSWKSVEKRLASTVNLPLLWDEISDAKAQANVKEILMLSTGGVKGGKLNQNTDQREKGTWSTLLSINSNLCFKEYVAGQQQTHTAGINRVLEFQINPPDNPVGRVSPSTAGQALLDLSHNYGNVGLEYAKMLGQQHEAIQKRMNVVLQDLETALQPTEEDRFWIGTLAALLVGAELANRLNAGFDIPAMETFLYSVYELNKTGRVEANVSPTAPTYAEDYLTAFLKDHLMATIWCEGTPHTAGKASHVPYRRLFPNAPLPHGVSVRFDASDTTLRLSVKAFKDWCGKQQTPLSATSVTQGLKKLYGLKLERRTLSAGTQLGGGGQEYVYTIDVKGHQDLIDMMNSQGPNNDLGASVGMTASAVDTGITTPEG